MGDQSDERDDVEYLRDVLKPMSPLWILNGVMTNITQQAPRKPADRQWQTIGLSMARGYHAKPEVIAAMNAQADARQAMLEANPAFRAALTRLNVVGVSPEWGSDGEYGWRSRVLRLFLPLEALSKLQDMAADDAGIETLQDRLEAAEVYRRWLLQSYHPDWKQYQEKWPTLYKNPYNTARNDLGRDPNPIKP